MTPADVTAIITAFIAAVSSIGIPLYLHRRAHNVEVDQTKVVSWDTIATRLDNERKEAKAELAQQKIEHAEQVRQLNADWQRRFNEANAMWRAQLDELKKKNEEQQREIDKLYRRLGQEK